MGQTLGLRRPGGALVAAHPHRGTAVGHEASLVVAVERHGPDRPRVVRVDGQPEAEVRGQAGVDVQPGDARRRRSGRRPSGSAGRGPRAGPGWRPNLWTHWPVSGYSSGWPTARTPRLRASQVAPPSAVWKTPTAEMPTHIRAGSVGCGTIEWRIEPAGAGLPAGSSRDARAGRRRATRSGRRRPSGRGRPGPRRRRACPPRP